MMEALGIYECSPEDFSLCAFIDTPIFYGISAYLRKKFNLKLGEEVSLLTDIDRWNETDKAITLMTIHSAKGLEFPVVIVVGLEEGLFPLGNSAYELEELEEERSLFYVAMTRAEEKVYLSYANARRRFGGMPVPCIQSRFIHELPVPY